MPICYIGKDAPLEDRNEMPPWPDPDRRSRPVPDPCLAPWHSAEAANPGRRAAFLLAVSLGFVGVHRFYLHQPLAGLGYLVFCWTLVPLLLALLDARALSRMSDCEFHEEYGVGGPRGGTRSRVPALVRARARRR